MKFGNINALWALLLVPALGALWMAAGRRARNLVQQLVAARLQPLLVDAPAARLPRLLLLLAGLALGVAALARPQWGEVTSETKGRGRDVLILVDVSKSMLANDLPPSRLQRAKLAAEDLVRQLGGDRIGIIAFAGTAFLQAPITADHAAVLTAIQELDPEIIPQPGTNICAALQCADEAFDRTEGGQRALVLISDGEELEADAVALAKELSAKMRIFTLGVGSPEGSILMIPSPKGGMEYIRDGNGNPVLSKLDESRLEEIASAGGGFYSRLMAGPAEVRHIAEEGIGVMEEHEVSVEVRTHALERFQWPLGGALMCLALGVVWGERSRRRVGAALALLLIWQGSEPTARATTEGRHLYDAGNFPGAQQAFTQELGSAPNSPERAFNLGTAAYKNKKWPEAIEAFGRALNTKNAELRKRAEYNLANTLVQQARQGRRGQDNKTLEQAMAHYDEALKRDGKFEDAQFNHDFVKRLLEEKPPEQKQKNDKDGKDKKEKKEGDQKDKQDGGSPEKGEKDGDKDGEKQDGEEGKDGKSGEQSKQSEKGEQGKKPEKDGQETAQNGKTPQPVEEKPGEQKDRGELKDSPTVDKPDKPEKLDPEAAALQAGNAAMTREQAAALVESLRSEDRRVQVWAPNKSEQKKEGSAAKTW